MTSDAAAELMKGVDTSGIAHEDLRFWGICAAGGKAVAAPCSGDNLLLFDPITEVVRGIDITRIARGARKYSGVCKVQGKVVAAPFDADKLLIFDPATETVKGIDITNVASGIGKYAGICEVGGKAVLAPYNADKLLIFDPTTETVKGIDVTRVCSGQFKFRGICEVMGKVVAAPCDAKMLLVFDPNTEEVRGVDISEYAKGIGKYSGICEVAGKAVAAPCSVDEALIFDPTMETLRSIDICCVARGGYKYSGVCEVAGKAVFAPYNADRVLILDPITEGISGIDISGVVRGNYKFRGICYLAGKAVAAPFTADKLLIFDPAADADCMAVYNPAQIKDRMSPRGRASLDEPLAARDFSGAVRPGRSSLDQPLAAGGFSRVMRPGADNIVGQDNVTADHIDGEGEQAGDSEQEQKQQRAAETSRLLGIQLTWVLETFPNDVQAQTPRTARDMYFTEIAPLVAYGPTSYGKGKRCPRDCSTDCSIVDALRRDGKSKRAAIFLSWAWRYKLALVLEALREFHDSHVCDTGFSAQRCFIWWCFFCNNQHRMLGDGQQITADELATILGTRLQSVGRMLCMMDNIEGSTYTARIWCNFEVFVADKDNIPIEVVLPGRCREEIDLIFFDGGLERIRSLMAIDSQNAQATSQEDEMNIKAMIQAQASFDAVNKVVLRSLVQGVAAPVVKASGAYRELQAANHADKVNAEEKMQKLRAENARLSNEVEKMQASRKQMATQGAQMDSPLPMNESERLRAENARLRTEIETQQTELSSPLLSNESHALRAEIAKLRSENEQMREQMDPAKHSKFCVVA